MYGSGKHCPPHGGHHHRGRRPRHGGHGWGDPWGPGFGGPWFGRGFGGPGGRGRKARRGDIRAAALLLLAEEPRNGYQIMQEVEERSGGAWRPSPGSVYPALSQLEDEGLIGTEEHDGRRVFVIADAGREALAARGERPAPWEELGGDRGAEAEAFAKLMKEVAFAFVQVMRTGDEAQIARAREVLDGARRELYRILADGEGTEGVGEA